MNRMIRLNLPLLLSSIVFVMGSSYHNHNHVSFVPRSNFEIRETPFSVIKGRTSRSYGIINELWPSTNLYSDEPPLNSLSVEINRNGHVTPDFSDGLDYPDPFLITGLAAQAIAKLLYSHELFFADYPHISALLRLQQIRRRNGLSGHKLGSLRASSPFYRRFL